jgi:hypothetical protein
MQRVLNQMMLNEINGDFSDKAPLIRELQGIMRGKSPSERAISASL